jgi:ammonium transporter, Amt family
MSGINLSRFEMKGLLKFVPLLVALAGLSQAQDAKLTLEAVNTNALTGISRGDTAWMIVATALVLLMTPALAFFYGGLARSKTVLNTMMMSFIALGVVAILWPLIGYTIAFGSGGNGLLGGFSNVLLSGIAPADLWKNGGVNYNIPVYLFMLFQMMFAVITPALISGAIIDRMKFGSYVLFISLWSLLIYAPLAHWVWAGDGWLFAKGALDFAGGTVVHIAAGVSGLVAAIVLGPRSSANRRSSVPHNIPFVLLGAALLWFGWFGFNAGSSLAADSIAVVAFMNTAIAPAAAMLAWLLWEVLRGQKPTAVGAATGAVVGLVAITPACAYVSMPSGILIGLVAATASFWVVQLKNRMAADDALDVFACHGIGGIVGALLTGVLAEKKMTGWDAARGLIDGKSDQLWIQFQAVGSTVLWAGLGTFVLMHLVKAIMGVRVSVQQENLGTDLSAHAEEGYTTGDFGYSSKDAGGIDSPVILNAND